MVRPLRLPALFLALALSFGSLATSAAAQNYDVVALQEDLADGGTLTDPEPRCIDYRGGEGDFVFFDDTNDLLATYDPDATPGSRTAVLRTAAQLDADAGVDVVVCRDLDTDLGGNVFVALSPADNVDLVYRTDAAGGTGTALTSGSGGDGITGLVVDGTTVWLARAQFFGAPEDGVYRVNTTGAGQTPAEVVTDADLDLTGIDIAGTGDLYATSSEFGVDALQNVVVRVEDPTGAATLSTVVAPCTGGSPVFENCGDGGLEDLKVGSRSGAERLFVFNNSFGGPEGEEIAQFDLDGDDPETVFTQADFLADPDIAGAGVTEYTPAGTGNGYMDYIEGELFLAGSSSFDGTPGIFSVEVLSGLANEPETPAPVFALDVQPNPMAGAGTVRVTVGVPQALEVVAYDALGRRAALLFRGQAMAGVPVTVRLDGRTLPAGVYVVRAVGEAGAAVQRVTVVR
jgi:hypothetical protein